MRAGRIFKWLTISLALVVAGWVGITMLLGMLFFLEDEHVDKEAHALHELPMDVQRVFPEEAGNIYRAWYWRGQTHEQFCRFDLPTDKLELVELWLLSHGANDLSRGTSRGKLPEWFRGEEAPAWWQVPAEAEVVYYRFFCGRRYMDAVVQPSRGRVWLKQSKI